MAPKNPRAADSHRRKLSPPAVARLFGVGASKVIAWIISGDLKAINAATRTGERPRYLIDVEDLKEFERSRAVVKPQAPPVSRKRRAQPGNVKSFV